MNSENEILEYSDQDGELVLCGIKDTSDLSTQTLAYLDETSLKWLSETSVCKEVNSECVTC